MSINACAINAHTLNAACGLHSVLSVSTSTYSVVLGAGEVVPPLSIGTFTGGPVTAVVLTAGAVNGPGGTLGFAADPFPATAGNIYFGGTATGTIGTYSGTIFIFGAINYAAINFTIQVVPSGPVADRSHPQRVHPDTTVPLSIFRRRPGDAEGDIQVTEQPFIHVAVEFKGQLHGQTLERFNPEKIILVTVSGVVTVQELVILPGDKQSK